MAARADERAAANPYAGGGAGGKLRVSRRGASKKSTPYDRPASARHAPSDCLPIPSSSSPSIKSRLVNTATRLISSSASFIFSSFLGRRSLQISAGRNEETIPVEDGDEEAAMVESSSEEEDAGQDSEETACPPENAEPPTPQLRGDNFVDGAGASTLVEVGGQSCGPLEKELDLVQVEGMLKKKTLSREQVDRLTGILHARVDESNSSRTQIAGKPVKSLQKDSFVREEEEEETLAPITEAQRWREELRRARMDLTPIEVARAYMGEKTSMPARWRSLSLRGIDNQISKIPEVHQPYRGLLGDNNWASPVVRSSTRTAVRPMRPAPVVDEGWMSVGPVRRTRQRVLRTVSQGPYARGLVSRENAMARANVSPPMQSSHTARKILDTLEKLSPSPKGRQLDGDLNFSSDRTPIGGLNSDRHTSGRYAQEFSRFSNLRAAPSNGRLDFESMGHTPIRLLSEEFNGAKQELTALEKVPSKSISDLHAFGGAKPHTNASEIPTFSSTAAAVLTSTVANANPFSIAVGSSAATTNQETKDDSTETAKKPFFSTLPSLTSNVSSSLESFRTSFPVSVAQPFGKPSVPAFSATVTPPVTEKVEDIKEKNEHLRVSETAAAGQIFTVGGQSNVSATGSLAFSKIGQSGATSQFGLATTSAAVTTGSSFSFSFSSPTTVSQNASSKTLPPLGVSTNTSFSFSPPAFPSVSCSTPTFSLGGSNGVPQLGSTFTSSPAPFGSKIVPVFGTNAVPPVFGNTATSLSSITNITEPLSGTGSATTSDSVFASESVSTSAPMFSFRSPFGGLKLPDIGSSDASFPEPTFTFGSGTSPPAPETSTQSPFSGPQVGFGMLGSTTGSGTAVLPTLKVVTPLPQVPFELTGGFASGPAGLEKSGRKFIKAKRRK